MNELSRNVNELKESLIGADSIDSMKDDYEKMCILLLSEILSYNDRLFNYKIKDRSQDISSLWAEAKDAIRKGVLQNNNYKNYKNFICEKHLDELEKYLNLKNVYKQELVHFKFTVNRVYHLLDTILIWYKLII
jgi:hypothetical protein